MSIFEYTKLTIIQLVMIKKTLILIIAAYLGVFNSMAALNSPENCQGSLRPYPVPKIIYTYPDSLTPIFINHV